MVIEFENQDQKYCGIGFSVSYELTDRTIETLFKIISCIPVLDESSNQQMKTLKLGKSLRRVSINKVIELINLAHKKIDLQFDEEVLKKIIEKD